MTVSAARPAPVASQPTVTRRPRRANVPSRGRCTERSPNAAPGSVPPGGGGCGGWLPGDGGVPGIVNVTDRAASTLPAVSVVRNSTVCGPGAVTSNGPSPVPSACTRMLRNSIRSSSPWFCSPT